jgi:biotin operon repressor
MFCYFRAFVLIRENFDFENASSERIYIEMIRRQRHMKSHITLDVAKFLVLNRDRVASSIELERKFNLSRATVLSSIGNLRDIHGFKIVNLALKGKSALYKLAGFEEPRGRGHTGRINCKKTNVRSNIEKPKTYNYLINKVFK